MAKDRRYILVAQTSNSTYVGIMYMRLGPQTFWHERMSGMAVQLDI
jgi:hypothetical protein